MRFLTPLLILAAFAPISRAEEKLYQLLLAEPVPPTVMPMNLAETDLTPVMREALAALEVSKTRTHMHTRYEPWPYPPHPITKEKDLDNFWIQNRTFTPDEAVFAYTCLGIAAEEQVVTKERLLKRIERTDIDLGFHAGSFDYGYTLKLACQPLSVRYSREASAQTAELERVTAAAIGSAVRRHRALLAALEPDFRKTYDLKDVSEARAAANKFPSPKNRTPAGPEYSDEAFGEYLRVKAGKHTLFERARKLQEGYEQEECRTFARVFLQWIPGDKDRIRKCLIDSGYKTPEARAAFWKLARAKPDYFFNDEHIARLYDPAKP